MPAPAARAFRLDDETDALLTALATRHGGKTAALRAALVALRDQDAPEGVHARYQTVLAAGRREARAALSEADLDAVLDVVRTWYATGADVLMLADELADRGEPGDDATAARIRALPASAVAALVDAGERYWRVVRDAQHGTGIDAPATPTAFMGGPMR